MITPQHISAKDPHTHYIILEFYAIASEPMLFYLEFYNILVYLIASMPVGLR